MDETSINFGIINSITKLHIVGISTESFYLTFFIYEIQYESCVDRKTVWLLSFYCCSSIRSSSGGGCGISLCSVRNIGHFLSFFIKLQCLPIS